MRQARGNATDVLVAAAAEADAPLAVTLNGARLQPVNGSGGLGEPQRYAKPACPTPRLPQAAIAFVDTSALPAMVGGAGSAG